MDIADIKKVWNKLTPEEQAQIEGLLNKPLLPNLLSNSFPEQTNFILDKSKMKALLGTRRMAKSYTAGLYLLKTALERPGTSSVYIGLTRDQSKRIIWNDILKTILRQYNIGHKLNETELTITLDNGSIIYVLGVNDSESEQDKLLGKKYALAVIDEAASYTIDLHGLIYKVLKPAMSDLGGTICLIGTPDDRKDYFYELTKDVPVQPATRVRRGGWSIHTWNTLYNPFMRAAWEQTISDLQAQDAHVADQPWFQQHYLGRWVLDESAKVYRYREERNAWDGNKRDYGWTPWEYVLGIDLGFEDATALVLLSYHRHDPNVYIERAEKKKGLTLTETANWIRDWNSQYPIGAFIVDGANKQGVEEMVRHHGLPLQAADKADKVSFIRIMNSDFVSGRIKVSTLFSRPLIEEYEKTIWNKRFLEKGVYKEDSSFHPDCCDAALYAYRFCYHYASSPIRRALTPEEQVAKQKEEWNRELQQRQDEKNFSLEGSEYLFDGIL